MVQSRWPHWVVFLCALPTGVTTLAVVAYVALGQVLRTTPFLPFVVALVLLTPPRLKQATPPS